VTEYDPIAALTIADPFPVYAALRRDHPMYWHEGMRSWVFSRYADCLHILKSADVFARDVRRVGEELPEFRQTIQSVDPPENLALRTAFVRAFKDQDLARLAARLEDRVDEIRAGTHIDESFDYVERVARPIALEASSAILGISPPDGQLVAELSGAIARRMDSGLDASRQAQGDAARHELNRLIGEWIDRGSDVGILSAFGRASDLDHYTTNTLAVIFNASYSTVFASLGTTMDALLDAAPDVVDEITSDSDCVADELVRFAGPTQGTSRRVTQDVELHGRTIERGGTVVALVASANRDERAFAEPDRLDFRRSPNRHLGFGWGPHSCFGAPLGKIAVAKVQARLLCDGDPLVRAGPTTWTPSATLRVAAALPVATSRARSR
jgi:cytochrome P450